MEEGRKRKRPPTGRPFPETGRSVIERVAKSPIRDLTLPGKGKASFSLSLQIIELRSESLIWAPRAGRIDDFLRSHQLLSRPMQQAPELFLPVP